MDTGDLTNRTYNAILSEGERFHHDLALQFGLLADQCADEEMFVRESEKLVLEMLTCEYTDMEDIFFDHPPTLAEFHHVLERILGNISSLKTKSD